MKLDEENSLFNNIKSAHIDNYIIADSSWRFFLKVEVGKLYKCKSQKAGWHFEVPGEIEEQFQSVEVVSVNDCEIVLKMGERVKSVEKLETEANHYFGR